MNRATHENRTFLRAALCAPLMAMLAACVTSETLPLPNQAAVFTKPL